MTDLPNPSPGEDDALVGRLVAGDEEALRDLHRRYARLVFSIAARALGEASAEDVVQEIFLSVWQKRSSFDPARGTFKTWLLQIARNRVLNEVRARRSRGGTSTTDVELDTIADETKIDDVHWDAYRRSAVRAAIEALPPPERQALSLAYMDDLTNAQVASYLHLPLGTAKSRIRTALRRLAPLLAALVTVAALLWIRRREEESRLTERALEMTTASDVVPLRLSAAPGLPPDAHATYRAHPSGNVAVLTSTALPPLPRGEEYDAWVRYQGQWTWLGTLKAGENGRALVAAEVSVRGEPEVVQVTREPSSADHKEPRGPVVLGWPSP